MIFQHKSQFVRECVPIEEKKEEVATSYSWQNRQSSLLGRLIGVKNKAA